MSERTDRAITALRTGHDDLVRLAEKMTPEDLACPSGSSEWTVAQVISHLGSGSEIMLATLNGALAGTGVPEAGFRETVWTRWDGRSAQEQAEAFPEASEALVRRFEELDEATRNDLRVDLGFLPQPIDVLATASVRLGEVTHHTWDVQVAFDPAATLATEPLEFLFDTLGVFIGFVGKPAALDGRQLTLTVRTTQPDRTIGVDLRERVALIDAPESTADVLELPAEAFLRLTAGRLAPAHTPAEVQLTSTVITLDDLRQVFPGY